MYSGRLQKCVFEMMECSGPALQSFPSGVWGLHPETANNRFTFAVCVGAYLGVEITCEHNFSVVLGGARLEGWYCVVHSLDVCVCPNSQIVEVCRNNSQLPCVDVNINVCYSFIDWAESSKLFDPAWVYEKRYPACVGVMTWSSK